VVFHILWLARANEHAPHWLDSHTRVQIVLPFELLGSWLSPVVPHELEIFLNFNLPLIKIAMLVCWFLAH
jgi:hypothetical protein